MLRLTLGPLPAGVAAHVLDFAETEVLFSARGLSRHFKAACDGACGLPRLRQLLARARHLVEVTPHWRPDSAEAGLFHSHFEGNGLAFCHKSVALLGALSQLRALENLQRAHFQWHCIDTPQKVDRYLDGRLCRARGLWQGPGSEAYTEQERKDLPTLFSTCRWLLRSMVTAPAPNTVHFYHAFVDTMGVDGMGADGLPIQIPLLCWEPA
ncbi:unnamed protein product [Effrenium voratum]|nr:unnamed protein product [Effrenium voratum]